MEVGLLVIRGPDWAYKNQDGGRGHVGTVISLVKGPHPRPPDRTVMVQWDNGGKGLYRTGYDNTYDLRILSSAESGVLHVKIWCDGCDKDEIAGIRWRCTECTAIDLCTDCYMNNKHDVHHVFMRVESSALTSMGPKMHPRRISPFRLIHGIFSGAKVVNFPAWFKKGQDSHRQNTVTRVVQGETSPLRQLSETGHAPIACIVPASGGCVYEGHLPVLGYEPTINDGDKVLVSASVTELEKLQTRRGLWEPHMEKIVGKQGVVSGKTDLGDLVVTFKGSERVHPVHPCALRKLHRFVLCQPVRVSEDVEMVKRLQTGHGGWTANMKHAIGKDGKVVHVDGLDVKVKLADGKGFIFNAASLMPEKIDVMKKLAEKRLSDLECIVLIEQSPKSHFYDATLGDVQRTKEYLDVHPEWVNEEIGPGLSSLLTRNVETNNVKMVRLFLERGAFTESLNNEGYSSLHIATFFNHHSIVELLLNYGADVGAVSPEGFTSLDFACTMGHKECARHLLQHGADVNLKCKVDAMFTPLLNAASRPYRVTPAMFDLLMGGSCADIKAVNAAQRSVMALAATCDNAHAVSVLIEKCPRLVEARCCKGLTPLMSAAIGRGCEAAEILITNGHCNLDVTCYPSNHTAVSLGVISYNMDIVEILVRSGATCDTPNYWGNSTLHIAHNHRINTSDKQLPDKEFLTKMEEKWGHLGVQTNPDALVAYLVTHGASLDVPDYRGVTIRQMMQFHGDRILPALTEIEKRLRHDISKQQVSPQQLPLRSVSRGPTKEGGPASAVPKPENLSSNQRSKKGSKKGSKEKEKQTRTPHGTGDGHTWASTASPPGAAAALDEELEGGAGLCHSSVADALRRMQLEDEDPGMASISKTFRETKPDAKAAKNKQSKKCANAPTRENLARGPMGFSGLTVGGSYDLAKGQVGRLRSIVRPAEDELASMHSRVHTSPRHLVRKRITFMCGHVKECTIAELTSECPLCHQPISSTKDVPH